MEVGAILDMKWSLSSKGQPSLALTTSSGDLNLYLLNSSRLVLETTLKIDPENNPVILSLDWNNRNRFLTDKSTKIATSDSKGCVHIVDVDCDGDLKVVQSLKNHGFESWVTVFDVWNENVVYSGGDDCQLFMSDLRIGNKVRVSTFECFRVTCF